MNAWPENLHPPQPQPEAPTLTRDQAILLWLKARKDLNTARLAELNMRNLIVGNEFPSGVPEGTNTIELGNGYKLKATGVLNYSLDKDAVESALDAIEATSPEGKFIAERLVGWTPQLSVAEYRTLPPNIKALIDRVLTIKPGQSQLEFYEPKVKG